ncbi:MAG: MFS transporter [Desulfomonilia bacterium]
MRASKEFYGWHLICVLWLIYFINIGFVFYGSSLINTFMVLEMGFDRKTLGGGFALFHYVSGLSAPLAAYVINKKGIRTALALGSLVLVCGAVLMATVVRSTWVFLLVYGPVMGVGIGFGSVLSVQTGVTLWFNRKRALAMSLVLTASGIGGVVAAPSLNLLISTLSGNWRAAWLGVSVLCLVSVVMSVLCVRNRPSDLGQVPDGIMPEGTGSRPSTGSKLGVHRTSRIWTRNQAMKTPSLWLIFIGIIGYFVPFMFCVAHGVIHLMDNGLSQGSASLSLGLLTLFSIVGRLLGGFLGDRIEPRHLGGISLLVLLAGVLACMGAHDVVFMVLYASCVGIGFGCAFVMLPTLIGNYYGPDAFASIVGMLAPLYTLFSASAPFAGGVIYDATGSYHMAFMASSGICALGACAIFLAREPERGEESRSQPQV